VSALCATLFFILTCRNIDTTPKAYFVDLLGPLLDTELRPFSSFSSSSRPMALNQWQHLLRHQAKCRTNSGFLVLTLSFFFIALYDTAQNIISECI
jgi:hypothetical protein